MGQEKEKEHLVIKKKLTHEDSYFAERDREIIEKHRKEAEKKKDEEERRLHHMKCPKCGGDLKEKEFKDILIDICTECAGVWLDKGELQTLLKKEASLVKSLFKTFFEDEDFGKLK